MLGADDPAVPALQDVVTAAQRARELTAQMLTVSGKQQTPEQPVDLNAIIRETLQLLRVSIPAAVILEDAFEADLPLTRGDPSQLRQIIMNLVINAADAIGQDDGRIRIATSTVTVPRDVARPDYVLTPRPGTYACLEVRDSGPGMDEETVARVFDPFFTTKPTGHGLGLPAVLGIVRGHGGTIRVESRAGQGTEFRVLLPLMAQQGSESAPRPQPVRPAAAGGILIVEDDDAIRSMLGRAMEARGFRAFLARDGVEGVEAFRSHAGEVACVLMDIMMPRLNGLDALTQMREHRQDVPVILMSGYVENEIPARLIGSSVAAFIRKPFRLADLDEVLRQVISTRQDI
jgi:CheY-like chemotaxis protein